MAGGTEFNRDKMAELILYISKKCEGCLTFGATLLNKMLYYADFLHYGRFGYSITGDKYLHRQAGPVPEHIVPVREELIKRGDLDIEERNFLGKRQIRTKALRDPNLDLFSAEELETIDNVIDELSRYTATMVSEATHREIPWILTQEGEEIPYYTVFIRRRDPIPMEYLAEIQKEALKKGIK